MARSRDSPFSNLYTTGDTTQVAHGFEDISDDFSVWVLFYGSQKQPSADR
jgi:hypothetical protein